MRVILWLLLIVAMTGACRDIGGPLGDRGDGVLYNDSFTADSLASWQLEADEISQARIEGERLVIQVQQPDQVHYTTLLNESFTNFTLQLDATLLTGSATSSYGIIFRFVEGSGFYRFAIMPNGHYQVEMHFVGGDRLSLTDGWVKTTHINAGVNQPNRLQVTTNGSQMSFFINGALQIELQESSFGSGSIALGAGTFSEPGLLVAFDNLTILEGAATP